MNARAQSKRTYALMAYLGACQSVVVLRMCSLDWALQSANNWAERRDRLMQEHKFTP